MRIGLFAHRLARPESTGVGRYFRELAVALHRVSGTDHELVLASTPEPAAPDWVPEGIRVGVVGHCRRPVHAAWWLGAGPTVERSLGSLDVVHLLCPFPPARSVASQVVTVHDVMPLDHPEWYPRSERVEYRRTIRLVVRRAKRVVVPSTHVANRLAATLGVDAARMTVVPEGVSGAYADNGSSEDLRSSCARVGVEPGRFALTVGAVSTRKNLIPVIRAITRLEGPSLPLLIVGGDGHGAADTDAEIARAQGRAEVRRTGYLPDGQVAALVRSAAVLVHPALEEGFGLVPLEAMAVGTPVVAGRVSSIPEVVGDAALLVDDPDEPAEWARCLARLLESTDLRTTLAFAGRTRAARFTWERTAEAMLDIYRDAIRG